MGQLIILLGPTGAGKTAQSERLAKNFGYAHISTGELLRRDFAHADVMASGQLVPSPAVEQLLSDAVSEIDHEQVVILDGFPRTNDEASWLMRILPVWGRSLKLAILIDVDQNISSLRLLARQRPDDTGAAIAEKWIEYTKQTAPVIEMFRRRDVLQVVDGNGTIDEVYSRIEELLS